MRANIHIAGRGPGQGHGLTNISLITSTSRPIYMYIPMNLQITIFVKNT
jgi:hypothetical protein